MSRCHECPVFIGVSSTPEVAVDKFVILHPKNQSKTQSSRKRRSRRWQVTFNCILMVLGRGKFHLPGLIYGQGPPATRIFIVELALIYSWTNLRSCQCGKYCFQSCAACQWQRSMPPYFPLFLKIKKYNRIHSVGGILRRQQSAWWSYFRQTNWTIREEIGQAASSHACRKYTTTVTSTLTSNSKNKSSSPFLSKYR